MYAIWTLETKNESDNMDIMFQYSDDNGATWTSAVKLNDDATVNSQFTPRSRSTKAPATSLSPGTTPGATSAPAVQGTPMACRTTTSRSGPRTRRTAGWTFAPSFQVSRGTSNVNGAESFFDYGDYTHAAFESGTFYPGWSDNSNSTGDNPDGTLHQLDLSTAKVIIG